MALSLALGCQMREPSSKEQQPSEFYRTYARKIEINVERLDQLHQSEVSQAVLLAEETVRASLDAARTFQGTLADYSKLLKDLETRSQGCQPSDVSDTLERSEEFLADLREQSRALDLLTDAAENQHESLRLQVEGTDKPSDLTATHEYFVVLQKLSSLTASVDGYASFVHRRQFERGLEARQPPIAVLGFLRLCKLQPSDTSSLYRQFEASWRQWMRAELERKRFDRALQILALVVRSTQKYRPDSVQDIARASHAVLEEPPPLKTIERMERSLDEIEKTYSSGQGGPGGWQDGIRSARAALLFCRAYNAQNPQEGVALLHRALTTAWFPALGRKARAYAVTAAQAVSGAHVAAGRYAQAINAFREALSIGAVRDRAERESRHRSSVFKQALSDCRNEVKAGRFPSAREILAQAAEISQNEAEDKLVRKAQLSYYDTYAEHLLARDPERAIALCQEAMKEFPLHYEFRRLIDRGLHRRLRAELGDVGTAYRRLGATRVQKILARATDGMFSLEGAAACREHVSRVAQVWSERLKTTSDPEDAFKIALELEKLNGADESKAREAGAAAIWALFAVAMERKDWNLVERSVDAYFALCPEERRPEDFEDGYVGFLEELERGSELKKLGRHLAIFAVSYPKDIEKIEPIVRRQAEPGSPMEREFTALLQSFESNALESLGKGQAADGLDDAKDLESLIARDELARAARWREEPDRPAPTRPTSPAVATPAGNFTSGIAIAGSVLLLVLLPLLTLKKGLLPFRWYALGAVWVGLTVGLCLGLKLGGPGEPSASRACAENPPTICWQDATTSPGKVTSHGV